MGTSREPQASSVTAAAATAQVIPFPARPRAAGDRISSATSVRIDPFGEYLTQADHAALAAWIDDPSHGYGRLHVERHALDGRPHVERHALDDAVRASFALIYVPGIAWSAWGVTRREGAVETWRCATGKTVARHQTMAAALASLPHASEHRRAATAAPRHRSRA